MAVSAIGHSLRKGEDMDRERPRAREKNVTGKGTGLGREGSGLGTGPVGSGDGYSGRGEGGRYRGHCLAGEDGSGTGKEDGTEKDGKKEFCIQKENEEKEEIKETKKAL